MFKMAQKDTYTWPVSIEVPVDGGRFEKCTFDAEFKRLQRSEIDALLVDLRADDPAQASALLNRLLVGWSGVTDDAGQPIPFSDSARDQLLNIHPVAACVVRAWTDSLRVGSTKN